MIESDKKATYTKELWDRWHDARKEWEDHAREDIDFYLGNHFSESESEELAARNQSNIPLDRIYSAIEQFKAIITSKPPKFSAMPREDSDSDIEDNFIKLFQSGDNSRILISQLDNSHLMADYWYLYEGQTAIAAVDLTGKNHIHELHNLTSGYFLLTSSDAEYYENYNYNLDYSQELADLTLHYFNEYGSEDYSQI